eukprot:evm.model.scf_624.6 EVM.evm.TU.scf_624.6   scf_624:37775-47925(+)
MKTLVNEHARHQIRNYFATELGRLGRPMNGHVQNVQSMAQHLEEEAYKNTSNQQEYLTYVKNRMRTLGNASSSGSGYHAGGGPQPPHGAGIHSGQVGPVPIPPAGPTPGSTTGTPYMGGYYQGQMGMPYSPMQYTTATNAVSQNGAVSGTPVMVPKQAPGGLESAMGESQAILNAKFDKKAEMLFRQYYDDFRTYLALAKTKRSRSGEPLSESKAMQQMHQIAQAVETMMQVMSIRSGGKTTITPEMCRKLEQVEEKIPVYAVRVQEITQHLRRKSQQRKQLEGRQVASTGVRVTTPPTTQPVASPMGSQHPFPPASGADHGAQGIPNGASTQVQTASKPFQITSPPVVSERTTQQAGPNKALVGTPTQVVNNLTSLSSAKEDDEVEIIPAPPGADVLPRIESMSDSGDKPGDGRLQERDPIEALITLLHAASPADFARAFRGMCPRRHADMRPPPPPVLDADGGEAGPYDSTPSEGRRPPTWRSRATEVFSVEGHPSILTEGVKEGAQNSTVALEIGTGSKLGKRKRPRQDLEDECEKLRTEFRGSLRIQLDRDSAMEDDVNAVIVDACETQGQGGKLGPLVGLRGRWKRLRLAVGCNYPRSAPRAVFKSTDEGYSWPEAQAARIRFEGALARTQRPVTVTKLVRLWHDCCSNVAAVFSTNVR